LKLLGQSEYGLYQLIGSIIAFLAVMDFGLSATITRFYSEYKTLNNKIKMENTLFLSCIIYALITIALVMVGAIFYFNIDNLFSKSLSLSEIISAKRIYVILLINLSVTIPTKVFDAVIISYEKFIFIKALSIIQTILQPFIVIVILLKWPTAFAMVMVQFIFNVIVIIIRGYYCLNILNIKIKLHYFDKAMFFTLIKYSVFIFIGSLLDQLFWKSNHIILGIYKNTTLVAVYGVALTISNCYMSLSTAITSVFLPKITELITKKASDITISDLFIKIGRIQFMVLACILSGFVLFGKQFIGIWAGKGFEDTYIITLILIAPFTVDLIQNIGLTILQAKNKLQFRSMVFMVIAIVNILVTIPMTKYFGILGCAASAATTFFIGNAVIMNIYYAKVIKINIKLFWINILKILIITIGCLGIGIIINKLFFGTTLLNLVIKGIVFLFAYLLAMWKFCMNEYEKNILLSIRKKIIVTK
jgi:Membrane protein involved in the export of O-antigen and teichoic acid